MPKLNFNSIISCVDSYIIDYPRVNMFFVCCITLILLVFFSPMFGILWLIFSTVYFFYFKKHKDIVTIWGVFFFSWYFMFTACMFGFDGHLLIRGDLLELDLGILVRANLVVSGETCEDSYRLLWYVIDKYNLDFIHGEDRTTSFFNARLGDLCMFTLFLLSLLSSKLGISIYVPSLFHI